MTIKNYSNLDSPVLANSSAETAKDAQEIRSGTPPGRDLDRPVYCVLGIPIDAVTLKTVEKKIQAAAAARDTFLISTPNLNFLVSSLSDPEFRESLLNSDICPPDGAPIIWIAKLLGLPIVERAAGADLLDRLKTEDSVFRPITIFLFGGAKGVAAAASENINALPRTGLSCIGTMDPGFCNVGEMSKDHIIAAINASGADFLVVSLGAKKGQLWLRRNHQRLAIPIRSHLGAAINFQAGTIKRASPVIRAWGLEWLWRIKEERYLWKRYRDDGFVFLRLLLTSVLPLMAITCWQQVRYRNRSRDLLIKKRQDDQSLIVSLSGAAEEANVTKAASWFREALTERKDIIVDLANIYSIDARFLGLLLMLRKELASRGQSLKFAKMPRGIKRIFRLHELTFLLDTRPDIVGASPTLKDDQKRALLLR